MKNNFEYNDIISLDSFCEYLHEKIEEYRCNYISENKNDPNTNPIKMKFVAWFGDYKMKEGI